MFKNLHHSQYSLNELKNVLVKEYQSTISIAHNIKHNLDQLDETTANILLISLMKLNNSMDDYFSRIYYYHSNELLNFHQYLNALKSIGLKEKDIHWIKRLREYRNQLVHAIDIKEVLHYLFTTELKVMRFIIVVENTVKIVKQYFNQEK